MYRHALVAADHGLTLLMGSSSGGLWRSENSGAAWHTILTTLPPIDALGFF